MSICGRVLFVQVSERDMRLTFLPATKMCIEAGTFNLMCSYNRLDDFYFK